MLSHSSDKYSNIFDDKKVCINLKNSMYKEGGILQGNVTLKRKTNWVQRYATINAHTNMFSYKNNKNDKFEKYKIDLANATVKTGIADKMPYMIIEGGTEVARGMTKSMNRQFISKSAQTVRV